MNHAKQATQKIDVTQHIDSNGGSVFFRLHRSPISWNATVGIGLRQTEYAAANANERQAAGFCARLCRRRSRPDMGAVLRCIGFRKPDCGCGIRITGKPSEHTSYFGGICDLAETETCSYLKQNGFSGNKCRFITHSRYKHGMRPNGRCRLKAKKHSTSNVMQAAALRNYRTGKPPDTLSQAVILQFVQRQPFFQILGADAFVVFKIQLVKLTAFFIFNQHRRAAQTVLLFECRPGGFIIGTNGARLQNKFCRPVCAKRYTV